MPERLSPGPVRGNPCVKEAVCVHTRKVYDSCRDKDCVQDLRVYLTQSSQQTLDRAATVKPVSANLIWVYVDVDSVPFNKGFYTVDAVYYYRITAEAFMGVGRPVQLTGVASYTKRVILYGSEGKMRTFYSTYAPDAADVAEDYTMPSAAVEAVEPILLQVRASDTALPNSCGISEVPDAVLSAFEEPLVLDNPGRTLYATVGQFSIVKLERETQLLIPVYDSCIPEKICESSSEDPCQVFDRFRFPVEEFNPPDLRASM
ncbi:MAG: hypothetical protein II727_07935 [Oscillospiraceae bacterium]|nr:hypothetical protein [Oscillospiraceae bacterium]